METIECGKRPGCFDVERERVFDCLAPEWDTVVPQAPRESLLELIAVSDVRGLTVLDVGAGTGVLVEAGLAAGAARWIACDLSSAMLRQLEKKYKAHEWFRRLVLLHADVHSLPLENGTVDRVICHNAFPHFDRPRTALAELFRVLRPGGRLVINHFSGRDFINQVHRSASHAVLQGDLLPPAAEAAEWLAEAGFTVAGTNDDQELYRITAVRPETAGGIE